MSRSPSTSSGPRCRASSWRLPTSGSVPQRSTRCSARSTTHRWLKTTAGVSPVTPRIRAAALRLFHLRTAGLPADEQHRAVLGLSGQVRYARENLGREILADLPGELVRPSSLHLGSGDPDGAPLRPAARQHPQPALPARPLSSSGESSSPPRPGAVPSGCRRCCEPTWPRTRDHLGDLANDDWLREAARITAVEPGGGDPAETVRLYVAAGAWPEVLDCMDRHGVDILRSRDLDWLDRIPLRLRQRETWLRLSEATRAMRDGQLDYVADLATIPEETETTSSALALSESLLGSSRLWSIGDIEPDGPWFDQLRSGCVDRLLPGLRSRAHRSRRCSERSDAPSWEICGRRVSDFRDVWRPCTTTCSPI